MHDFEYRYQYTLHSMLNAIIGGHNVKNGGAFTVRHNQLFGLAMNVETIIVAEHLYSLCFGWKSDLLKNVRNDIGRRIKGPKFHDTIVVPVRFAERDKDHEIVPDARG